MGAPAEGVMEASDSGRDDRIGGTHHATLALIVPTHQCCSTSNKHLTEFATFFQALDIVNK
jgi:hypothetical protein